MTEQLRKMPDVRREYLKALASLVRRPRGSIEIPRRSVHLRGVSVANPQLDDYREICGFADGTRLPMTYLQVLAAPMQIHLLARPGFPLPLLGLVHLRNEIEQQRLIEPGETGTLAVATEESRQTERGLEFDLVTRFRDAGDAEIWRSTATVLFRNRPPAGGRKSTAPEGDGRIAQYWAFEVPEDLGRRYARISGDRNPIHLRPWTARLFGFKRHIAHGMWSLARTAAFLEGRLQHVPRRLSVQFRQPLFLPGQVALRYYDDGSVTHFALLNRSSGKIHLTGALG